MNHLVTYKRRCIGSDRYHICNMQPHRQSGNYGAGITQESTGDEVVMFGASQDEALVEKLGHRDMSISTTRTKSPFVTRQT